MKLKILNVGITIITYRDLLNFLFSKKLIGYATLNDVHSIIQANNNSLILKVLNNSTFSLCDGRPIYWLLKNRSGSNKVDHITGRELMLKVCERSAIENKSIGIYGGKEDVQQVCVQNLKKLFPNLKIKFLYSPKNISFNSSESDKIINSINNSNISFLFVCLGCPKQEVWMNLHKNKINCFMFGVGAAIDYIANSVKPPKKIVTNLGLEWLYRVFAEPKRLFKRYLYVVPKFIYLMMTKNIYK